MKRRVVTALLAVLLALIGGVSVLLYVKTADARVLAGKRAVSVLVATKRIPAGTKVDAIRSGGYVESVPMPASSVPGDAVDALPTALDKLVLTAEIQPRQVLLRGMLAETAPTTGGLALPEGKMAVSVQMSVPAAVAGYVKAGSKIAIFDTFTVKDGAKVLTPAGDDLDRKHEYTQATRLLLPRVEVIGVGAAGTAEATTTTASSPAPSSGKDKNQNADANKEMIIVVVVAQDEAEKLVHGAQVGRLYLALLDDKSTTAPGPGVDNNALFGDGK